MKKSKTNHKKRKEDRNNFQIKMKVKWLLHHRFQLNMRKNLKEWKYFLIRRQIQFKNLPFLLFLKSKYNHYRKAKKMTSSVSSLKNIRTLIVLLLNSRNLQNMMKKANNLQALSKPRFAKNTLTASILQIKSDKSYTFITFSTSS